MKTFEALERGVYAALETYSNVHRGSGHHSQASTHLYEKAREIVLEYLALDKSRYMVIFCSPRQAAVFQSLLKKGDYRSVSGHDIGLPLGITALAVRKGALPDRIPFQTGGGTARLVSPHSIVWAKAPDRFEPGTPAVVNAIALAIALRLVKKYGDGAFREENPEGMDIGGILYQDELDSLNGKELLEQLRLTLIGGGVQVPTADGKKTFINLDNAASTPTFSAVWKAVTLAWRQPAPVQQEINREVKSICMQTLGAPGEDYEVIFTSNTSESINLAAESLAREFGEKTGTVVVNTILEHNSNELPWRKENSFSLIRMGVDETGLLNREELESLLRGYNKENRYGNQRIRLVSVSGASNVLGICNDLEEIARVVHQYGARLLVDAAQLVAHRKVEMAKIGIDYLAFSAHKVYAPFGTGVLVVRKGLLKFTAREMDLIHSSGEENTAGIAALGKALVLLQRIGFDRIQEEELALTGFTLGKLAEVPGLKLYGITDPGSPNFDKKAGVIIFTIDGLMSDQAARVLSEQGGIGVRAGCHCAHLLVKHLLNISPFLARFQHLVLHLAPGLSLPGVTRISLGIENNQQEIETLIRVLGNIKETAKLPRADIRQKVTESILAAEARVYLKA